MSDETMTWEQAHRNVMQEWCKEHEFDFPETVDDAHILLIEIIRKGRHEIHELKIRPQYNKNEKCEIEVILDNRLLPYASTCIYRAYCFRESSTLLALWTACREMWKILGLEEE